jgi:hypothetical protein
VFGVLTQKPHPQHAAACSVLPQQFKRHEHLPDVLKKPIILHRLHTTHGLKGYIDKKTQSQHEAIQVLVDVAVQVRITTSRIRPESDKYGYGHSRHLGTTKASHILFRLAVFLTA